MAVKVLITRLLAEGRSRAAFELLNEMRTAAMNHPGYITGETLLGYDDPRKMVIISTWQSYQNWQKWMEDPKRKALEENLLRLQQKPTACEAFVMGTYPSRE